MAKWFEKNHKKTLNIAIEKALAAIGTIIVDDVLQIHKRKIRRITGRAYGSIGWRTKDKKQGDYNPEDSADMVSAPSDEYTVNIGTNVEYEPYLEYGTKRMAARPHLRPGLDKNRKKATRILRDMIMKEYR